MPRTPDQYPSEKLLEVLRFIILHVEKFGYQPSQAEIAKEFGVTKNAITSRLKSLEQWGLIQLPKGKKDRAILIRYVSFQVVFLGGHYV